MEKLKFAGFIVRVKEKEDFVYYFRFYEGHELLFLERNGFICLMDEDGKSEYCLYNKLSCPSHYWGFKIELVNADHVLWLLRELNKEENFYKAEYLIRSFIEAYNQTYLKNGEIR